MDYTPLGIYLMSGHIKPPMHIAFIAACLAICLVPAISFAEVPSHCKDGEFAILDAWMGKTYATQAGWRNARTGKLLSLCSDQIAEPFSRVTYRYGVPGRVELEVNATAKTKFNIDSRQTSPHTGNDLVFFKRGKLTYYVAIAIGQGHGVTLIVFNGNQRIAEYFSGNEDGEDFKLGPAEIDFESRRPISPVLARAKAKHDF